MEKIFREIKKRYLQFENKVNLDFSPHIHEDIELIYVKKGGGTAFCDGKKYELHENSFFLVFPNQVHHYSEFIDGEYIMLIIKPSRLMSYNDVFLSGEPVSALWHFEENTDDNTAYLLQTAFNEFIRDGYSPIIDAYLTAVFGKLLKFYKIEKGRLSRDNVLQILQYCADHYKENITVGDIADNLHISRSCVSHIFSSRLGMNFCDYINALRLSDAKQFLESKNYSITEISDMSGFATIRTFNRAFLKLYGISPSEYRKFFKNRGGYD